MAIELEQGLEKISARADKIIEKTINERMEKKAKEIQKKVEQRNQQLISSLQSSLEESGIRDLFYEDTPLDLDSIEVDKSYKSKFNEIKKDARKYHKQIEKRTNAIIKQLDDAMLTSEKAINSRMRDLYDNEIMYRIKEEAYPGESRENLKNSKLKLTSKNINLNDPDLPKLLSLFRIAKQRNIKINKDMQRKLENIFSIATNQSTNDNDYLQKLALGAIASRVSDKYNSTHPIDAVNKQIEATEVKADTVKKNAAEAKKKVSQAVKSIENVQKEIESLENKMYAIHDKLLDRDENARKSGDKFAFLPELSEYEDAAKATEDVIARLEAIKNKLPDKEVNLRQLIDSNIKGARVNLNDINSAYTLAQSDYGEKNNVASSITQKYSALLDKRNELNFLAELTKNSVANTKNGNDKTAEANYSRILEDLQVARREINDQIANLGVDARKYDVNLEAIATSSDDKFKSVAQDFRVMNNEIQSYLQLMDKAAYGSDARDIFDGLSFKTPEQTIKSLTTLLSLYDELQTRISGISNNPKIVDGLSVVQNQVATTFNDNISKVFASGDSRSVEDKIGVLFGSAGENLTKYFDKSGSIPTLPNNADFLINTFERHIDGVISEYMNGTLAKYTEYIDVPSLKNMNTSRPDVFNSSRFMSFFEQIQEKTDSVIANIALPDVNELMNPISDLQKEYDGLVKKYFDAEGKKIRALINYVKANGNTNWDRDNEISKLWNDATSASNAIDTLINPLSSDRYNSLDQSYYKKRDKKLDSKRTELDNLIEAANAEKDLQRQREQSIQKEIQLNAEREAQEEKLRQEKEREAEEEAKLVAERIALQENLQREYDETADKIVALSKDQLAYQKNYLESHSEIPYEKNIDVLAKKKKSKKFAKQRQELVDKQSDIIDHSGDVNINTAYSEKLIAEIEKKSAEELAVFREASTEKKNVHTEEVKTAAKEVEIETASQKLVSDTVEAINEADQKVKNANNGNGNGSRKSNGKSPFDERLKSKTSESQFSDDGRPGDESQYGRYTYETVIDGRNTGRQRIVTRSFNKEDGSESYGEYYATDYSKIENEAIVNANKLAKAENDLLLVDEKIATSTAASKEELKERSASIEKEIQLLQEEEKQIESVAAIMSKLSHDNGDEKPYTMEQFRNRVSAETAKFKQMDDARFNTELGKITDDAAKAAISAEKKKQNEINQTTKALRAQMDKLLDLKNDWENGARKVTNESDQKTLNARYTNLYNERKNLIRNLRFGKADNPTAFQMLDYDSAIKAFSREVKNKQRDNNPSSKQLSPDSIQTSMKTLINRYDALITKAKQYGTISGEYTEDLVTDLEKYRNTLAETTKSSDTSVLSKGFEQAREKLKVFSSEYQTYLAKLKSDPATKIQNTLANLANPWVSESRPKQYQDIVSEFQKNYDSIEADFKINGGNDGGTEVIENRRKALAKLNSELQNFAKSAKNFDWNNNKGELFDKSIGNTSANIGSVINNVQKYGQSLGYTNIAVKNYSANGKSVVMTARDQNGELINLRGTLETLPNALGQASYATRILTSKQGESASFLSSYGATLKDFFRQFTMFYTGYRVVQTFFSKIREGIGTLKEYDSALRNISYTVNFSKDELSGLGESSLKMARDLSMSLQNATSIYQIYANMQSSISEINDVSKPTAILSNLASIDASTAADQIQGVLEQFDLLKGKEEDTAKESMHIVDVYNDISSNIKMDYAKGIQTISQAVQATGAVAHDVGMSFEELAAISAKVAERTREDGSSIGNALKTIFTRITKVGKMPGYEDIIDNATIGKATQALHAVGVEVYNADGSFRNINVILGELAKKWDTLTDAQQSYISFQVAATRQSSKFRAILESFADAQELAAEATNSSGSALENQEKYADSFEAKFTNIKTQADIFWIHLLNSDTARDVLDEISSLIKGFNELADTIGTIPTLLSGVGVGLGLKTWFGKGFYKFPTNLYQQITGRKSQLADLRAKLTEPNRKLWNEYVAIQANPMAEQAWLAEHKDVAEYLEKEGKAVDTTTAGFDRFNNVMIKNAAASSGVNRGISTIIPTLKNIGIGIANFAANAAIMFAISWGVKEIYNKIHEVEIAQNKLDEITQQFDDIQKKFEDKKKTADDAIKTYKDLDGKVDFKTGENIDASTEEYDKFLSVNKEIATLFPELITTYDENGNAILNLGNNAEIAAQKIEEVVSASQKLNDFELISKLDEYEENARKLIEKNNKDEKEFTQKRDDAKHLKSQFESSDNHFFYDENKDSFQLDIDDKSEFGSKLQEITLKAVSEYEKTLDEKTKRHFQDAYSSGFGDFILQRTTSSKEIDQQQKEDLVRYVNDYIDRNFNGGGQLGEDIYDYEGKILSAKTNNQAQINGLISLITKKVHSANEVYTDNTDLQPIIDTMITSLSAEDLSKVPDGTSYSDYIDSEIIARIANADNRDKILKAYNDLFSLDDEQIKNMSREEIKKLITNFQSSLDAAGITINVDVQKNLQLTDRNSDASRKAVDTTLKRISDSSDLGKDKPTLRDAFGELSENDYQNALKFGSNQWDEVYENAKKLADKQNELIPSAKDYASALHDVSEKWGDISANANKNSSDIGIYGNVESLSKGLDQLKKIYDDIADGKSLDYSNFLNNDNFSNTFDIEGLHSQYEDFIKTVMEYPDDIKQCQSAFDDLTTAYLEQSGALDGLNEKTKEQVQQQLEQKNIINAKEVVDSELQRQQVENFNDYKKDANTILSQEDVDQTKAYSKAKMDDVVASDAFKTANLGTKRAIIDLVQSMIIFNNNGLSVEGKIAQLQELAIQAGLTKAAVEGITVGGFTKTMVHLEKDPKTGKRKKVETTVINGAKFSDYMTENMKPEKTPVKYGGGSSSSSKSGGSGGGGGKSDSEKEKDILSELSGQLDKIQSAYKSLADIQKDYNNTGKITVDQAQELINSDLRYLSMLDLENGQLKINEEGFKNLQQAKLHEMQIQLAKNAIDSVNALKDEASAVEFLNKSYKDLGNTELDVIESQLAEAVAKKEAVGGKIGEAAKAALKGYQNVKKMLEKVDFSGNASKGSDVLSELSSQLDKIQNGYKSLIELEEDYNKHGKMTVDQAQELIQQDFRFLANLDVQNGKLHVNEQAFQDLAKAKLNEMKIQLVRNAIDTVNSLADEAAATEYLTNAYHDLADAELDATEQALAAAVAQKQALGGNQAKAATQIYKGVKNALSLLDHTDFSKGGMTNSKEEDIEKNAFKKFYDWTDIFLKKFSDTISKLTNRIEKMYTFWSKNSAINQTISTIDKELQAKDQLIAFYEKQMKQYKIPKKYKKLVEDGAISGTTVRNQKLSEKIDQYKEWHDKIKELKQQMEELQDTERNLIKQKLDSILEYYDNIMNYYDSIASKLDARVTLHEAMGMSKKTNLRDALDKLANKYNSTDEREKEAEDYKKQYNESREQLRKSYDRQIDDMQNDYKKSDEYKRLSKKKKLNKKDQYVLDQISKVSADDAKEAAELARKLYSNPKNKNAVQWRKRLTELQDKQNQDINNKTQERDEQLKKLAQDFETKYNNLLADATKDKAEVWNLMKEIIESNANSLREEMEALEGLAEEEQELLDLVDEFDPSLLKKFGIDLGEATDKISATIQLLESRLANLQKEQTAAKDATKAYQDLVDVIGKINEDLPEKYSNLRKIQAERDTFTSSNSSTIQADQKTMSDLESTYGQPNMSVKDLAQDYRRYLKGEDTIHFNRLLLPAINAAMQGGLEKYIQAEDRVNAHNNTVAEYNKRLQEQQDKINKSVSNKWGSELDKLKEKYKDSDEIVQTIERMKKTLAQADWSDNTWATEWRKQLEELKGKSDELTKEVLQNQRKLGEAQYFGYLQEAIDKMEELKQLASAVAGIFDDEMSVDKNGLTQYGASRVQALGQQIAIANEDVAEYNALIAQAAKRWEDQQKYESSNGKEGSDTAYTFELYQSDVKKYQTALVNATGESLSAMRSIYDLMNKQIEKEIQSINKLADARKKALQAKKEYLSYSKQIDDSTKNINSLQAQIDALKNVNTEEAKSKVESLQSDLEDAQDTLKQTEAEHLMDLELNAFDDYVDRLQSSLEDAADDVNANLEKMLSIVEQALKDTSDTSISETLTNIYNKLAEIDLSPDTKPIDLNIKDTDVVENKTPAANSSTQSSSDRTVANMLSSGELKLVNDNFTLSSNALASISSTDFVNQLKSGICVDNADVVKQLKTLNSTMNKLSKALLEVNTSNTAANTNITINTGNSTSQVYRQLKSLGLTRSY